MIIKEQQVKYLQTQSLVIRSGKVFHLVEYAASETAIRFVNCRKCKRCKDDDEIEVVSIKEGIEKDFINKSVKVDIKNRICTNKLLVIHDPLHKLILDKGKAIGI